MEMKNNKNTKGLVLLVSTLMAANTFGDDRAPADGSGCSSQASITISQIGSQDAMVHFADAANAAAIHCRDNSGQLSHEQRQYTNKASADNFGIMENEDSTQSFCVSNWLANGIVDNAPSGKLSAAFEYLGHILDVAMRNL